MKSRLATIMLGLPLLGLATAASAQTTPVRVAKADQVRIEDGAGQAVVQKVPFRTGVSSVTVERMARGIGCRSDKGAGRIAGDGPLEIYRLQCEDGRIFMAQCELRQCRPLR